MEEITKHPPSLEGDYMCGRHYRNSDEYALVATNDGSIIGEINILFKFWDAHLKNWFKHQVLATKHRAEIESLKWLLQNAGNILELTTIAVKTIK